MSTLTLTAENPEILLEVQSFINNMTGISEVKQKESANLRKARVLAELKADLKEAFEYIDAIKRGDVEPLKMENLLAELRAEKYED